MKMDQMKIKIELNTIFLPFLIKQLKNTRLNNMIFLFPENVKQNFSKIKKNEFV